MARPLHHWTDAVLPAGIDYDAIPSPVPRGASPHRYRRFLGRTFSSFSTQSPSGAPGLASLRRFPRPFLGVWQSPPPTTGSSIQPWFPARRYEARSSPERPLHLRFQRPFIGKFAFGDRTIPIHARTLGPDEHNPNVMGVYYGTVQSAVVHTN